MFDGLAPQSFLAEPGAKEAGVEMFSMSKTYGMAGWRLGFVVGNAEIVERVNLLADHVRAGVFVPIQEAGVAALTGPQESVEERRALYEARRERVQRVIPEHALGLDVLRLVAAPGRAHAGADPGRAADRRRARARASARRERAGRASRWRRPTSAWTRGSSASRARSSGTGRRSGRG